MNKVIKLLSIPLAFLFLLSIMAFASNTSSYTFYYEDREITIETAYLDEESAKTIADYIAYGLTPAELITPGHTLNTPILCILFGHSIETSYAIETIHNVYTTSPKCVRNKYQVEICTRESCDYIQTTLVNSTRISVCHG